MAEKARGTHHRQSKPPMQRNRSRPSAQSKGQTLPPPDAAATQAAAAQDARTDLSFGVNRSARRDLADEAIESFIQETGSGGSGGGAPRAERGGSEVRRGGSPPEVLLRR